MSRPARLERTQQLGLFDVRAAGGFSRGRRHALDAESWIDHFPSWLGESVELFAELAEIDLWEQRSRWMFTEVVMEPRLTAEYSSLAESPRLERVAGRISEHYGIPFDSAWMNLYRNHEDGTGWHADRPVDRLPTATVPVLSLGSTRRFLVRPKAGGKSTVFHVENGDLIVMGGRCQQDWVHMVPKETRSAGARISVNFGSSVQIAAASRLPRKGP